MATRFYFPATGTAPINNVAAAAYWTKTSILRLPMYTVKQNTSLTARVVAWPDTATGDWIWWQCVSPPLATDFAFTTSHTSGGLFKVKETTTSGNANTSRCLRVVSNDGLTVRGTLMQLRGGTEFPTTAATVAFGPGSFTANVNALAGDRIIWEQGVGGTTPAAENITMTIGDPTGTADYAYTNGLTTDLVPWVEISANVTFAAEGAFEPGPAGLMVPRRKLHRVYSFPQGDADVAAAAAATDDNRPDDQQRPVRRVRIRTHPSVPEYLHTGDPITDEPVFHTIKPVARRKLRVRFDPPRSTDNFYDPITGGQDRDDPIVRPTRREIPRAAQRVVPQWDQSGDDNAADQIVRPAHRGVLRARALVMGDIHVAAAAVTDDNVADQIVRPTRREIPRARVFDLGDCHVSVAAATDDNAADPIIRPTRREILRARPVVSGDCHVDAVAAATDDNVADQARAPVGRKRHPVRVADTAAVRDTLDDFLPAPAGSGTGSNTAFNVNPTPSYPADVRNGNLALLFNFIKNDAGGTLTPPADWTLLANGTQGSDSASVYQKTLDGTESGTITVTTTGTTGRRASWITQYAGDGGIWSFEDVDVEVAGVSTTLADNDVTTSGINRLSINLIGYSNRQTGGQEGYAGESGGTWVPSGYFEGGNNPTLSCQTAGIASAATVGGGSDASITNSGVIVFGLAIYTSDYDYAAPAPRPAQRRRTRPAVPTEDLHLAGAAAATDDNWTNGPPRPVSRQWPRVRSDQSRSTDNFYDAITGGQDRADPIVRSPRRPPHRIHVPDTGDSHVAVQAVTDDNVVDISLPPHRPRRLAPRAVPQQDQSDVAAPPATDDNVSAPILPPHRPRRLAPRAVPQWDQSDDATSPDIRFPPRRRGRPPIRVVPQGDTHVVAAPDDPTANDCDFSFYTFPRHRTRLRLRGPLWWGYAHTGDFEPPPPPATGGASDGAIGGGAWLDDWFKLHERHEEWRPEPTREKERQEYLDRIEHKRQAERQRIEAREERKRVAGQAKETVAEMLARQGLSIREHLAGLVFLQRMEDMDAAGENLLRKEDLILRMLDEEAIAILMLSEI